MPLLTPDAPNIAAKRGVTKTPGSLWNRTLAWWREAARYRLFLPLLLLIIAFTLFLPHLGTPQKYLFDEILFAYTAGQYTEGNTDAYRWDHLCSTGKNLERCVENYPDAQQGSRIGRYQWDHPPMARLVMAGTILLFGNDPVGWRIGSVVAGAAGLLVAYFLGWLITGKRAVGLLTALLLLVDNMYFLYSRMGLLDIYLTLFMMSSLLALAWYLKRPPHMSRLPLLMIGLFLGLSISTKWSAAYGSLFIGIVILVRFFAIWVKSRRPDTSLEVRLAFRRHLVSMPVALGIIPILVYLAAHIPFFLLGHHNFNDFIELQKETLRYHLIVNDTSSTASRWWTWPLDMRSVWFGTRSLGDGRVAKTYALGNPLLYWAFLPAVGWTLVRWWRSNQSIALIILMVGFFGQWLPWIFVGRSSYLYHFLPAVPFACVAVAASIVHIYQRWDDWRRTLIIEYVILTIIAFAFFYPIVSYYPLSDRALGLRMWLQSWI